MIDLIAVCGPTASGKTALGVAIAEHFEGEVVSADAFAVYRGLDIGTAKPDRATRERIHHHLIDIADPTERYSAGMFIRDADAVIADIARRGRCPVIVGGTHFYVRALLYGLFPEPPKDFGLHQQLEQEWQHEPGAVRRRLEELDPVAAQRIAAKDIQRNLRAMEVCLSAGRPMSELWVETPRCLPRYNFVMLGLCPPRADLHARIARRVETMMATGLLQEVQGLLAQGLKPECHALKAIGYQQCCRALANEISEDEAQQKTIVATRQLAKRQITWLRKERDVEWLTGSTEELIIEALGRVEARRGTDSRSWGTNRS